MSLALPQHCTPVHYSTQPLIPINFFFKPIPHFQYFYISITLHKYSQKYAPIS